MLYLTFLWLTLSLVSIHSEMPLSEYTEYSWFLHTLFRACFTFLEGLNEKNKIKNVEFTVSQK